MHRRNLLGLSLAATSAFVLMAGTAIGQQLSLKDHLVGTWMVVSIYNILPDGKRLDANGSDPKGTMVFDSGGQFSQIIIDSTVPKYASNNRRKGTSQDFERVARGDIAYYGKYIRSTAIRRSRFTLITVRIPTWITATEPVR